MRKQLQARVISSQELAPGWRTLWLDAPAVASEAHPGQFLMVRCGQDTDPLLRRAMSMHRWGSGEHRDAVALLFSPGGRGTAWLASRQKGDTLDIIGPLGRGYQLAPSAQRVLVVAEGWGVAPAVALAERALGQGCRVTFLLGATTAGRMYPPQHVPQGAQVVLATADGSAGEKGQLHQLLPRHADDADAVFASGSSQLYRNLAALVAGKARALPVQVLVEARMACGLGICYGCAVPTRDGVKLACADGPRFALEELVL